jgi:hypothetical protein
LSDENGNIKRTETRKTIRGVVVVVVVVSIEEDKHIAFNKI